MDKIIQTLKISLNNPAVKTNSVPYKKVVELKSTHLEARRNITRFTKLVFAAGKLY